MCCVKLRENKYCEKKLKIETVEIALCLFFCLYPLVPKKQTLIPIHSSHLLIILTTLTTTPYKHGHYPSFTFNICGNLTSPRYSNSSLATCATKTRSSTSVSHFSLHPSSVQQSHPRSQVRFASLSFFL